MINNFYNTLKTMLVYLNLLRSNCNWSKNKISNFLSFSTIKTCWSSRILTLFFIVRPFLQALCIIVINVCWNMLPFKVRGIPLLWLSLISLFVRCVFLQMLFEEGGRRRCVARVQKILIYTDIYIHIHVIWVQWLDYCYIQTAFSRYYCFEFRAIVFLVLWAFDFRLRWRISFLRKIFTIC